MDRWSSLTSTRKRALVGAAVAMMLTAAPGVASAQEAEDVLKFTSNMPVLIVNQIKADKTTEFEEGWAGIRQLIAKSEMADLQAFGESLGKLFRVDQPAFDAPGGKAVLYIFQLDSPSTTYSYNPGKILYEYLKAGLEGSKITRAEADAVYAKLQAAYLAINPPWKLIKAGG